MKPLRKKRKFELGRPPANTKVCHYIIMEDDYDDGGDVCDFNCVDHLDDQMIMMILEMMVMTAKIIF